MIFCCIRYRGVLLRQTIVTREGGDSPRTAPKVRRHLAPGFLKDNPWMESYGSIDDLGTRKRHRKRKKHNDYKLK